MMTITSKHISDLFHKVFWTLAKRLISVGELTLDVGETTSYVGELTRWRNDRLPSQGQVAGTSRVV